MLAGRDAFPWLPERETARLLAEREKLSSAILRMPLSATAAIQRAVEFVALMLVSGKKICEGSGESLLMLGPPKTQLVGVADNAEKAGPSVEGLELRAMAAGVDPRNVTRQVLLVVFCWSGLGLGLGGGGGLGLGGGRGLGLGSGGGRGGMVQLMPLQPPVQTQK
jgi:hypothetical protein